MYNTDSTTTVSSHSLWHVCVIKMFCYVYRFCVNTFHEWQRAIATPGVKLYASVIKNGSCFFWNFEEFSH